MSPTASIRPQQPPRRERGTTPQRDRFVDDFNDEDLERALRTVSWNSKDVANFLRSAAAR